MIEKEWGQLLLAMVLAVAVGWETTETSQVLKQ